MLRRALHDLCDEEGRPCDAKTLWTQFAAQAPPTIHQKRLKRVKDAIEVAQAIADPVSCPDEHRPSQLLDALVELGAAFAELSDHALSPHTT